MVFSCGMWILIISKVMVMVNIVLEKKVSCLSWEVCVFMVYYLVGVCWVCCVRVWWLFSVLGWIRICRFCGLL